MKKTILMLAGLLALTTGCDEKNIEPEQPAADEISVSPENVKQYILSLQAKPKQSSK